MWVCHKHPLRVVRNITGIDRIDYGEQLACRDDNALFLGPSFASVVHIDLPELFVMAYGRNGGEIDGLLGKSGTSFCKPSVFVVVA